MLLKKSPSGYCVQDMSAQKIYWVGRHATCPDLGVPLSKVHKAGLKMLESLGWAEVPNNTQCVPVFAFTTRKGAKYPADMAGLPPVRQLPECNTACLDDKRQMQQNLYSAGQHQWLPCSWATLDDYTHWLGSQRQSEVLNQASANLNQLQLVAAGESRSPQPDSTDNVEGSAPGSGYVCCAAPDPTDQKSPADAASGARDFVSTQHSSLPDGIVADVNPQGSFSHDCISLPGTVFVKHRLGVKGQAVYVVHTFQDLQELQDKLKGSAADFVVQQEVDPMLLDGRKFVLRVHVLGTLQGQVSSCSPAAAISAASNNPVVGNGQQHPESAANQSCSNGAAALAQQGLAVYVHKDVIVAHHASAYKSGSNMPAVHVSSRGSGHPHPVLLQQLPALQAGVWPQLQELCKSVVSAVEHLLIPAAVHPDAALYHIFGFDCMVDAVGKVVLLEVNSYPAIASGTMAAVSTDVYTRLIRDMVTLLVLPLADGAEPIPGGFVLC